MLTGEEFDAQKHRLLLYQGLPSATPEPAAEADERSGGILGGLRATRKAPQTP